MGLIVSTAKQGRTNRYVVPGPGIEGAQNWVLITLYVLDGGGGGGGLSSDFVSGPARVVSSTLHAHT